MDPITALANVVTALLGLAKVAAEGQTPEQKAQIWAWFIADVAWWRKALKIDKEQP